MSSVLAFSRPVENKIELINLAELLPNLLERWRPRLARLNVRQDVKVLTSSCTISGDLRSLEQVFNNLIGNAVEAMKETGGSLVIHIRAASEVGGLEQVEISIADDGPGIPDGIRERIFEPFFTTNRNGTGLGLAIAKRIITAHKGTIQVASVPGGTVFQVIFPLVQTTGT
jgi:signal transduction histidine kinase